MRVKDRKGNSVIMKDETRLKEEHNTIINLESIIIRIQTHASRCMCAFHSILRLINLLSMLCTTLSQSKHILF